MIHKDLPFDACEIKLSGGGRGKATTFEGYASVWGRVDSYGDTILKGAFDGLKAEGARVPMMLYQHNPSHVIGKWLQLEEDDKGLFGKGELTPGHSMASDVAASMKHEAITGLSIGGFTKDWEQTENEGRIIKSFELFEVSIVAMPAETEARIDTASVKSLLDGCKTIRDVERLLRDEAGLSNSTATAIVATLRKITRGDLEEEARKEAEQKLLREFAETFSEVRRTLNLRSN